MLLWEGVAFSFLSKTEPLLPLPAHHAPRAPPGPGAARRLGGARRPEAAGQPGAAQRPGAARQPGAARRPEALPALAPRPSVSYL